MFRPLWSFLFKISGLFSSSNGGGISCADPTESNIWGGGILRNGAE